jgi:hypothetical protein
MATQGRKTTLPRKGRAAAAARDKTDPRFTRIGNSTSEIVTQAATLLDEEIAAGIVAARQMQNRFQRERRIDPGDFRDALTRFQNDAHQVVSLLADQFAALRSQENEEIINRFTANAHGLLDLVVEMVNTGAEVANEVVQQSKILKNGKRVVKQNGRNRSSTR